MLRALLAAGVLALTATAPAMADQITLSGTGQSTSRVIWLSNGTSPGGQNSGIVTGFWTNVELRSLLRFDVAENLPAGAEVTGAHLVLHTILDPDDAAANLEVYGQFTPWTSSATWATPDGLDTWDGGLGAGGLSYAHFPGSVDDGAIDTDVTDLVFGWAQDGENDGFLLAGPRLSLYTISSAHPPELVIDYIIGD